MELRWAEYLSVGNEMIDADHKHLIAMVNRLEDAIRARNREALTKAFEVLDTFMDTHLRNEERLSEAIMFPFAKNRIEHRQLMFEMRRMMEKLESRYDILPLPGWMAD